MRTHIVQSNFTSGEIAPTLHGRIDIDKYYNSLAIAENVVIMPHGGIRRRGGLTLTQRVVTEPTNFENVRLETFSFNSEQRYTLLFYKASVDMFIYIHSIPDDVFKDSVAFPVAWTKEDVRECDYIQSADTVLIAHKNHPTILIVRDSTDDTIWTLSEITFTNIPTFDFGTGLEPVWSATRGYPSTLTFHKGRLWLGGSASLPSSVWASVVNDFYNFDTATAAADRAIFNTLDDNEFNEITGIISGRDLQIFTSGTEFIQKTDIPTPTDSNWVVQTRYGAKRIRPTVIDGATYYVDSSGSTIRQHLYADEEGAYISQNIALLSSHLLNDIKEIKVVKARTTDISDLVIVVNGDGTVAVLNSMRHEGVLGWSKWNTQGEFIDVAVSQGDIYFIVKRINTDGAPYWFKEKIQEGTYTDHNTFITGTEPITYNVTYETDNVTFGADNVVFEDTSTGVYVSELEVNTLRLMEDLNYRLVLETSVQEDITLTSTGALTNKAVFPRPSYHSEVGLNYNVTIKTLPLNVDTKQGGNINLRKRVVRAILNIYESLGISVQDSFMPDKKFIVELDVPTDLYTGIKEIYLLGYGRIVDLEITQTDPLPLFLLNLDIELEF